MNENRKMNRKSTLEQLNNSKLENAAIEEAAPKVVAVSEQRENNKNSKRQTIEAKNPNRISVTNVNIQTTKAEEIPQEQKLPQQED